MSNDRNDLVVEGNAEDKSQVVSPANPIEADETFVQRFKQIRFSKTTLVMILIWVSFLVVFGFSSQLFFRTWEDRSVEGELISAIQLERDYIADSEEEAQWSFGQIEDMRRPLLSERDEIRARLGAEERAVYARYIEVTELLVPINRQRNLARRQDAIETTRVHQRVFYIGLNGFLLVAAIGITMALEKKTQ